MYGYLNIYHINWCRFFLLSPVVPTLTHRNEPNFCFKRHFGVLLADPNSVPMVSIVFSRDSTHKYPLYRAYIRISHRGPTFESGYIRLSPLLPKLALVNRDKAHASRRVAQRPWLSSDRAKAVFTTFTKWFSTVEHSNLLQGWQHEQFTGTTVVNEPNSTYTGLEFLEQSRGLEQFTKTTVINEPHGRAYHVVFVCSGCGEKWQSPKDIGGDIYVSCFEFVFRFFQLFCECM